MKFNFKFNYICYLWEGVFMGLINKVQDQKYNAPFGFLRTSACAPAIFFRRKDRLLIACLFFFM